METGSFLEDGHKFARLAPKPLGENLSLFNAISCVLVWVFMHGASGEASPTFGHANANFSVFIDRIRNQFLKK